MLKRIKNSAIIVLLVLCSGCSLSFKSREPLLDTCKAHFDTKIESVFSNEKVKGIPSTTFVYNSDLPGDISIEVNCLLLEINKQTKDTEVVMVNFFNQRTKSLVQVVLDRKNGAFILLQFAQSKSIPEDQVFAILAIFVPLDGMMERLAGKEDAFVMAVQQGNGLIPLADYKRILAEATGGKVSF